jgi:CRP-like cAMP-binding protein
LNNPEDAIVRQDENKTDMFVLTKGFCTITVLDERKVEVKNFKILRPGDHFGEISLIYGCARTASVISQNYITLAKIKASKFKQVTNEYPDIVSLMKD